MSPAKKPTRRPSSGKRPFSKKSAGGRPGAKGSGPKRGAKRGGKRGDDTGLKNRGPRSNKKRPVKKAKQVAAPVGPPPENPRAKALAKRIAELVLDKKGTDVVILDVRGKTSYADYMVVASGESDRQVSAMADNVLTTLKTEGERPVGSEGQDTGNWVLLDYGEVVAHLFFNEVRAFYDLEGLWADAPREKVA